MRTRTTRRPPESLDAVPRATLRQMAAYTSALEAIYPGREVRAAVLYTQNTTLIEIPKVTLADHKRSLGETQDNYAPLALE